MKQLLITYNFLLLALLPLYSFAITKPALDKKKVIVKTFPLTSNQKVSITNQFGKVEVNNWERKEVKIEVTIITNAKDDELAQMILDEITIKETANADISFETKINANRGVDKARRGKNNISSSMQINYKVFMPASNPLYVKNSFGDTFINDRTGATQLFQSYGSLVTGTLSQLKDVKVEFGKLISEGIYASQIHSSYSDVNVKNLAGDVKSDFQFCGKLQLGLSKNIENLLIDASYSDLLLLLPEKLNASFLIKTSYGDLKNRSAIKLTDETQEKKFTPVFNRTYTGKSGNGAAIIQIKNSYGDVNIR